MGAAPCGQEGILVNERVAVPAISGPFAPVGAVVGGIVGGVIGGVAGHYIGEMTGDAVNNSMLN